MSERFRLPLGATCSAVYCVSFFLPACTLYGLDMGSRTLTGFDAFRESIGDKMFFHVWLANPVFWTAMSLLISGRYKWAGWLGATATALGFAIILRPDVMHSGYWCWLGSMGATAVGSALLHASSTKPTPAYPAVPKALG